MRLAANSKTASPAVLKAMTEAVEQVEFDRLRNQLLLPQLTTCQNTAASQNGTL